jgi:hypothetical protein
MSAALAQDHTAVAATDTAGPIADDTTRADKHRDIGRRLHYIAMRNWRFVALQISRQGGVYFAIAHEMADRRFGELVNTQW